MEKKDSPSFKGELRGPTSRLELAAVGLEAEFTVHLEGRQVRPEELFGNPRRFVRRPLLHRVGTSYHLPNGGAIYFDTGVIELATPAIEIAKGCAARAGRSLWESILFLREELDAWETTTGRRIRLAGFSTHYNISFDRDGSLEGSRAASVEDLARLLVYVLPIPVMLIAANRRSTGIGVRPRGERIEVTADFTPSPALMIAAATFITAVTREVMRLPSYDIGWLRERGLPVIEGFRPVAHSTRTGWVARPESYPMNPTSVPVAEPAWQLRGGGDPQSLREIGRAVYQAFRPAVRRVADPFTHRMLEAIFLKNAPLLLDLEERPSAYEDVGNLCFWDDLFPERTLSRSLYERVLIRAIGGDVLELNGRRYVPVGMRGWSEVVFERLPERTRHRFSIDFLRSRLDRWRQTA